MTHRCRLRNPARSITAASSWANGTQFSLGDGSNWSWEDLGNSSWKTINEYRINRSDSEDPNGGPDGEYCIAATSTTASSLGDPDVPLISGQLYSYVVTAVSGGGESDPGGPERTLTGVACP